MDLKRGVIAGVLLWVAIFFEVSILMFGFKLEGTSYYFAHFIIYGILIAGFASAYFKKAATGWQEGFRLGILFVLTYAVLDAIITVPLFVKDYAFFIDSGLLFGYLDTVFLATLAGFAKCKFSKTRAKELNEKEAIRKFRTKK